LVSLTKLRVRREASELAVLRIFIELVVDQGDELGIITSHRK
jgi:hypothetical protein